MNPICADNHLFFCESRKTWEELCAATQDKIGAAEGYLGRRCFFCADDMPAALGAVAFGIVAGLDFGVIESSRLSPDARARFSENGIWLVDLATGLALGAEPDATDVQLGRVTVLTSGTTGLLKLIPHTAQTLNTFDRVHDLSPNAWFFPYQIGSYAWYQMVVLGLFVKGQDLVVGDFKDLTASYESALHSGRVTAISSTPTFWRHALMSIKEEILAAAPLRSIAMGGEIVDQAILDRLANLYPDAKIRHIYASSEAGAAIVVTDGKAGFNATLLGNENGTIGVKIEDGRLFIRSPYGNCTMTGTWIDTGDLVEERNGRVYFCGRADNEMINVGGQKAFAPDIEAYLMRHPDVVWAQVKARRAPLVGYLPVAAVVLCRPMKSDAAEAMLTSYCQGNLADYAIPRLWVFLDGVPLRASLKS